MIKYILYQNDEELNRFNKYNIFTDDIKYFKSKVFNSECNSKFNSEFNSEFNFNSTYKNFYVNKLNQNQLNHLLSIKEIVIDAINNDFKSIMILEYDVNFHKDFNNLYNKYKQLIDNNSIIHLGSSQHKWYDIITGEKINIKEWKGLKYYNNSHSLGTFAIILKENVYKVYIDFINYVLYEYQYFPSDVILSIISRKYKSIVLYPNIVICDLDKSSILKKDRSKDYIKFKWYKHKYIC